MTICKSQATLPYFSYVLWLAHWTFCKNLINRKVKENINVLLSELQGVFFFFFLFFKDHPLALYAHCHAQKLNLVLMESCQCIPESKKLFVFNSARAAFILFSINRIQKRGCMWLKKKWDYGKHTVPQAWRLLNKNVGKEH